MSLKMADNMDIFQRGMVLSEEISEKKKRKHSYQYNWELTIYIV